MLDELEKSCKVVEPHINIKQTQTITNGNINMNTEMNLTNETLQMTIQFSYLGQHIWTTPPKPDEITWGIKFQWSTY